MKVLIVGSGGREHAIAASAAKSPKVKKMYCAPGNAGIAEYAECVPIGAMEFDKLVAFAVKESVDLTIVGMDDPLVGGLVDEMEAAGYTGMFYASKGELQDNLFWNTDMLEARYRIWVAQYLADGREAEIDHIPAGEFIAPTSIDFTHGRYICIDGLYYAYLLIPSDGYRTHVPAGWLSLMVNAGDGIDLDMFLSRQPKERIIQKVGQQLRINRSRIKDASDTNTDFDDIDSAIRSGYFLKEGLANNEDFYFMNLLVTVTAPNEEDLEWKVSEMKKLLLSQDMRVSSCHFREEQAFLTALLTGLAGIPFFPVMPLAGFLAIGLAVMMWFASYYKAFDLVKKRKKLIEAELPRFAVSIQQGLATDRDVLKLLVSYRRIAGPHLGQELDTTVADMKTGNYENALLHFQNRVGSTMLSDIVRGLIGTLRGDDQQMYFKMLVFDMRQIEQNNLKKEAGKRPKQMQKYSMMMLFCILLIYVVVLSVEVVGSLGAFF